MKQTLAMALAGFQGLGSDDFRERPVDRLAAMGVIGRQQGKAQDAARTGALCALGVSLIAFKHGKRESSGPDAEDMLAAILAWETAAGKSTWGIKTNRQERTRIASWAVREWTDDSCEPCTGSGISVDGRGVVRPCGVCGGAKKRLYSDSERITAMGGAFEKAMAAAHGIIGRAEVLAVQHGKTMLERW